jgi:hypothetical protein
MVAEVVEGEDTPLPPGAGTHTALSLQNVHRFAYYFFASEWRSRSSHVTPDEYEEVSPQLSEESRFLIERRAVRSLCFIVSDG